ncbi:hypothetical protein SALBM311S_11288 [Streptomyces alboniger]
MTGPLQGMTGPLHERGEAHALLAAEAERARAGSGRLVLLRGATGTGRTTVLEASSVAAASRGMRVLRARCSPRTPPCRCPRCSNCCALSRSSRT